MARTNLKSELSTSTAVALTVPEIRQNKGNSAVLKLIDRAIAGAKSVIQSINQVEPLIHDAAVACIEHANKHGDVMPADRLVKGLMLLNHPASTAMSRELVAWFRTNSPIRWDAKAKVSLLKEGDEGYKPFDEAKAKETAFNNTPQAQRARNAASSAHKNSLQAADTTMMVKRAAGVISFLNNMINGKDERPIKAGELPKMKRFAIALNDVLKDFGGETAVVPIASPKTETKKKAA